MAMRWEHWIYTVPLRLRSLLRRRQVEAELDEELRMHLEGLVERNLRAGMGITEARRAASHAMGGVELRKEQCRDMRRVNVVETLLQDLRYAFRSFGRSPGFSAVAVLTLAVGIGASTAILTVVSALLLRALPFPDAHRLVVLFATTPKQGVYRDTTSFQDFLDWKGQAHAFTNVAAYRMDPFNVTGGGTPEPVAGLHASHELLTVLDVRPVIGRSFDRQEQQGQSPVALISHGLWMRRFGGDTGVLAKNIVLNGVSHSVVGVLPQGFRFPPTVDVDVIVPIAENPNRSTGYLVAIARLKPGVSAAAAQTELDAVADRLAQAFPDTNRGRGVNVVPLREVAVGPIRTPLLVLGGAAVFVLLIGCANVANLVLAKTVSRRRELAVRTALGAGTRRLVRQMLTESVTLALVAAVLGAALAVWGSTLLVASLSLRFALPNVTIEWSLLAFAVGIALLTGLLCGLPPALMIRASDVNESLKQGSRTQTSGRGTRRLRSLLVVSETALTVVLLVGAGLLLRSFVLLQNVDTGVDPHHVLTADLLLSEHYAVPARRQAFLGDLLESIGGLPGVQQVAVHTDPPFLGGGGHQSFNVEGHADPGPRNGHSAAFNVISSSFFRAMGIPITRGRAFDRRDAETAAPVAIVNQTLARRFWPNQDPLGKRVRLYYDRDPQRWLSIVGVIGDVRFYGRDLEPVPQVFVPYEQDPYRFMRHGPEPFVSLVVRTTGDPTKLASAVEARIWAVDKDQPVLHLQSMEDLLAQSVAERRVYLLLLGIFAAIALVMATAGVYGLIAYEVARRTQELGVRIALGATRAQILTLVLRHGMLLTMVGVGLGLAGSLALTKLLSGLLYGIAPTDAPTFTVMVLLFAGVAFLATYVPARRAATIDPTVAFRYE